MHREICATQDQRDVCHGHFARIIPIATYTYDFAGRLIPALFVVKGESDVDLLDVAMRYGRPIGQHFE